VPLGEQASPPNYAREGSREFAVDNQLAGAPLGELESQQENQRQNQARSPDYARVLDRYIARLVSLKRVPDAVALFRRELDRNANDPGLYERLAAFLDQNHLGDEVEQVYQRAVAQFQNPSWSTNSRAGICAKSAPADTPLLRGELWIRSPEPKSIATSVKWAWGIPSTRRSIWSSTCMRTSAFPNDLNLRPQSARRLLAGRHGECGGTLRSAAAVLVLTMRDCGRSCSRI